MPIYRVERNVGGGTTNVPVPDFTYTNACLAQMIVDAWIDTNYQAALLQREADHITVTPAAAQLATESVNSCGFNLERAVVISEAEYYAPPNGYQVQHHDEIVFVLPNHNGTCPPGANLLDTARLLMAATPHGI